MDFEREMAAMNLDSRKWQIRIADVRANAARVDSMAPDRLRRAWPNRAGRVEALVHFARVDERPRAGAVMRGAAALLFVLGACAGDTGPRLTRFEIDHVDVIRGSAESARSNLPEVLAVLTRTGEGVEIRGMIPLRHPCDDVRGALLLDSAGPTPIVESREPARHRVGCDGPDRLSIAHYQATLGSLRRGCLRVRVRHEYPHGRAPAIPSQPWVSRVVADRWTSPPPNPPD